jgi:hypothetical protein
MISKYKTFEILDYYIMSINYYIKSDFFCNYCIDIIVLTLVTASASSICLTAANIAKSIFTFKF